MDVVGRGEPLSRESGVKVMGPRGLVVGKRIGFGGAVFWWSACRGGLAHARPRREAAERSDAKIATQTRNANP